MTTTTSARKRVKDDPPPQVPYRVAANVRQTANAVTLMLDPVDEPIAEFRAGQFTVLNAPEFGEVAASIGGDPTIHDGVLVHTIRGVGEINRALASADVGTILGVRGPFGTGWRLDLPGEPDLVLVGGGYGLATVWPALWYALANRAHYGRIMLVVGANTPAELLFSDELSIIAHSGDVELTMTVDLATDGWTGPVGMVTEPLAALDLVARSTVALLSGPALMLRLAAGTLVERGVRSDRIQVSLERTMNCGTWQCGECALGPHLDCRNGPVVPYPLATSLLATH
ncbi:MAG TPA: FAD/NAD(P)-binding protein [Actinophytocola sp.]|uniref:FAD/NAD(P)-binding protein n=1 Tax=Actinophytocola sp. TaxID=1872138 RepID=UPI002DDD855A|nr:FAD/NAD(P)-binding protein [Actinophytocola sp.]HEV2777969.1 FAD/NAD(P)-binding protein [Actinophytocola sp.]